MHLFISLDTHYYNYNNVLVFSGVNISVIEVIGKYFLL